MRILILSIFLMLPGMAWGQAGVSQCFAIAGDPPQPRVIRAKYSDPLDIAQVRISYVDHAMFLIQGGGASAATDYTGFLGMVDFVPDIVTMNNAHETHWTSLPDARIPHILRGWPQGPQPALHWIKVDDMVVRNVTSDTRSPFGGPVRRHGNSIFIFEVAGLCIAHLGHLHHDLTDEQYALMGHMDVVMVPVDGGATLPHATVINIMKRLQAKVVIPMHWFSIGGRELFLDALADDFAIDRTDASAITLSARTLPKTPTVMVMRSEFLRD